MTAAIFFAMLLLYVGIQFVLHARGARNLVMGYYRKYPRLYKSFFFGDWIANRPRLHIWLIRLGGLWAIMMALLLFLAVWLAASHR